ncbi:hypothetical protein V1280_001364 [Bradyrhizobium sp. AZCC 2230]
MSRAIAPKSMAHQWRTKICAVVEFSLGQGMAQNRAPLPLYAVAHQWRKPSLARIPPNPLCATSALPSATLVGAPLDRSSSLDLDQPDHITPRPNVWTEAREAGRDLVTLASMLIFNAVARPIRPRRVASLAARPVDSFAVLDRAETAAAARTHQRVPQRVCRTCSTRQPATASAHTAPTRRSMAGPKAAFAGLSRRRPHDRKSRGRGFRARNASTPFTLVDTGRSHEVRPARPLTKRLKLPKLPDPPAKRPRRWAPGGKKPSRCDIRGIFPISRRLFPQLFAALCSNTGGHP